MDEDKLILAVTGEISKIQGNKQKRKILHLPYSNLINLTKHVILSRIFLLQSDLSWMKESSVPQNGSYKTVR